MRHTLPGLTNRNTHGMRETRPERDKRLDAGDQESRKRSRTELDRLIEERALRKQLKEFEL